ncbi:MAG: hypothetical protein ACJ77N_14085 [Chloroflexota bacterium]
MTKERRLAIEGIVLAIVILVAGFLFLQGSDTGPGAASASPTTAAGSGSSARSSLAARTSSSAAAVRPSPSARRTAVPSASARPTPRPSSPPRTSRDPHLAYADFLSHVNDDRSKVDQLNNALSAAVTAGDRAAARTAATTILDFVKGERQWLLDHPPADCYAAAHAAGIAMLDAYQTAASDFVEWAGASGLSGLVALAKAGDAANAATDAFTAFGTAIVSTQCPG